jgi:hypothetical protein
VHDVNEL